MHNARFLPNPTLSFVFLPCSDRMLLMCSTDCAAGQAGMMMRPTRAETQKSILKLNFFFLEQTSESGLHPVDCVMSMAAA